MVRTFCKSSAALLTLVLTVDPAVARAPVARPSFDCRHARTPTERAICASRELAEADRRIDRRYWQLQSLPKAARAALAEDQGYFLAARDRTFEAAGRDTAEQQLLGALLWRADFLERIEAKTDPATAGRWANFEGEFTLTGGTGGLVRFTGGATEPVDARWTCEFEGTARWTGGALRFTDPQEPDWRMTIRHEGPVLVLEETNAAGELRDSPVCGMNGRLHGTYFRMRGDPFEGGSVR